MTPAVLMGLAAFSLSISALAEDTARADIIGNWARQDGETKIRITPCGDAICALNIWVKHPEGDEKLGDILVMKLKPRSLTELAGKAHDKRRGMTYSMDITLGSWGMQSRGCVLLGLLCKTAEWTRIQ